MTFAQFIDAIIQHALELNLADPYVAAEWRPRIAFFSKAAASRLWDAFPADVDFKQGSATVAMVAGVGAIPTTFGATGPQGGVWPSAGALGGAPLEYIQPKKMWALRYQASPSTSTPPRQYTIAGGSIYTYPLVTENVIIHYRKRRPVLIDNNDVSGGATDNGLTQIPEEYHEGLLFWLVWDLLEVVLSGGRANTEISPRAQEMLAQAVAERTQGAEQLMQLGDEGISQLDMV